MGHQKAVRLNRSECGHPKQGMLFFSVIMLLFFFFFATAAAAVAAAPPVVVGSGLGKVSSLRRASFWYLWNLLWNKHGTSCPSLLRRPLGEIGRHWPASQTLDGRDGQDREVDSWPHTSESFSRSLVLCRAVC